MRRFGLDFWNRDKTAIALNRPCHIEVMQFFMDLMHKDHSARLHNVSVPSGRTDG